MIEKLDKLALSTSLSAVNLCIDWPFKAFCSLFVRKGKKIFFPARTSKGCLKGREA